jgi:hypothetical protein
MSANAPPSSIGPGLLTLLLAWPVAVAALGGLWAKGHLAEDIRRLEEDRPRIVVVDEAEFVRNAKHPGTPEQQVQAALREVDALADKLAASGYVVLRANAVHRSPPAARINPE